MKNSLKIVIALALLVGCGQQDGPKNPCTEFDDSDLEMLNLIESIKKKYAHNTLFIQRFEMSQVYWVQYRDRHLRAIYPKDWDRSYRKENGTEIFNTCKCQELTRMTKTRVEELNLFMTNGPNDQLDCPSVWNE